VHEGAWGQGPKQCLGPLIGSLLDAEKLLEDYKGQSRVEKGFRFLKDDTFSVSDVYLKNEKRIEALAMVMVLCLLLYSVLEWRLREKLRMENKTVKSQTGKPVQKSHHEMGVLQILWNHGSANPG
jgi:transposase